MATPVGWIETSHAPEVYLPEYAGDPTSGWTNNVPDTDLGAQPLTSANPNGCSRE